MKNIALISGLLCLTTPVHAERDGIYLGDGTLIPGVAIKTMIIVILFYVVTSFFLALVRMLLDHRLKSKMLQMGLSDDQVTQTLQRDKEHKHYAVRWLTILTSAGAGFVLMSRFPFGWFSVGLLFFCLAFGFGAYYLYLRRSN